MSAFIKVGTKVRLLGGRRSAIVLATKATLGNEVVEGLIFLDRPLRGVRYWHESALTRAR